MQRALNGFAVRSTRTSLCAGLAVFVFGAPVVTAQSVRILVQNSPLAGFQYYAGTDQWTTMKVGDALELVRESDNAHDANAVRVDWRGHKLGYLPRAENAAVAAEMDRGTRIDARIAHLREHRNPWKRIGVDIFVLP